MRFYCHASLPSVLWRCWLGGMKGIRPVKNWAVGCWRGYLSGERCRQRISLPLTVSCFSKIQVGFTFLVPAHPGSPGQRAVKRVCVMQVDQRHFLSSAFPHKTNPNSVDGDYGKHAKLSSHLTAILYSILSDSRHWRNRPCRPHWSLAAVVVKFCPPLTAPSRDPIRGSGSHLIQFQVYIPSGTSLNWFSHFSTEQDTQAHEPCCICSNRLHLCTVCMPGLEKN